MFGLFLDKNHLHFPVGLRPGREEWKEAPSKSPPVVETWGTKAPF